MSLLYHVPVHRLAQRVLSHIRREELLRAGERVGVAVSAGIDSVALLRVLLELRGELGIVVSVVHFNHKLRGEESEADEAFVGALARGHGLEFFSDSDDVAGHARDEGISLEAAARELRYGYFRHLIGRGTSGDQDISHNHEVKIPTLSAQRARGQECGTLGSDPRLDKIVTGHTLDDQAETVLMRMIRGAGLKGLGGIHPRVAVEDDDGEMVGEIVRPLLVFRRRELEPYLKEIGQDWREDSSNAEDRYTRNRVRRLVVPLLERELNPAVAEGLAELAEIARGEEEYWENEVAGWMGTAVHWSVPEWARAVSGTDGLVQIALGEQGSMKIPTSRAQDALEMGQPSAPWAVANASVSRMWFLSEPVAVQRRLVKAIGEQAGIPLEFKHVEEVVRMAAEDSAARKEVSLPLGWMLVREADELRFVTPDLREPVADADYEYEFSVPGRAIVYEARAAIEARRIPAEEAAAYNPEQLLDAESLPGPLRVRNWRPGDRFWPAHTKSPKKIKELLQERHVAHPERKSWPVVVSGNGDEIVWVRGFPAPAKLRAKAGRAAVLIVDEPLVYRPEN